MALTERELLKALEKHGVKRREPVGERFDPHRDQAMFEIPDESVPNGTVMQVVQVGYMIGERVLRPAMVGVSKGGPARPATEPEAEKSGETPRRKHRAPMARRSRNARNSTSGRNPGHSGNKKGGPKARLLHARMDVPQPFSTSRLAIVVSAFRR